MAPSLTPLRRRALEVALLLAEPGAEAENPRAIGLALLDVLRVLAGRCPVVLALDDLHWLDSSSAGVLHIALRRLGDEPVGLLATLRRAPEVATSLELETAFPEDRLSRLPLDPLSLGALHRLLKERAGLRADTARARARTGGFGRQSVLRARARARARADQHKTRGRSGAPRPRELARAPRRPPGAATHRDRRRRALRRRARPPDGRARRDRPRQQSRRSRGPRCRSTGKGSSSWTTRACGSRTPCSRRSATSRQSPGSAAPSTGRSRGRSPISRSGLATWRFRSRGPTPPSPRHSSRPPRSRRQYAAQLPQRPSSARWQRG